MPQLCVILQTDNFLQAVVADQDYFADNSPSK